MSHASPPPRGRVPSRRLFLAAAVAAVVVPVGGILLQLVKPGQLGQPPGSQRGAASGSAVAPTPVASQSPVPAGFNKSMFSIDDPASVWFVVNKLRPIPDGALFVPPGLVPIPASMLNPFGHQLRPETIASLREMFAAALGQIGVTLVAQSGYRSYGSQTDVYQSYVDSLGRGGADATSARPGFSEHQTGFAIDILDTGSGCGTDGDCLGATPTGRWLAANAYLFGFLLRYQSGKTAVTGYEYEPWHFRFIGIELAAQLHRTGITTLEEFFGLPPAPEYAA